ncbi:major tail protein [Mycobacterium phage Anthony]|uniref:Major tail protein n=1 Tax=Mycobacterium phage Anthony TaxID=2599857 RepID=A0A5J6TK55_9CAUD|nr:major tail protein [Mycobacterium phage Anthony]QFG10394.1 major tail protein [Mycobacterium phage Anthony]
MSENDDAVLTAAVGYIYTNAVGSARPAASLIPTLDLTKPESWATATGWKSVGHTSRGTLPEFGFEGGDSEVKGSWQKKKLREIQSEDPIDYLTVVLHEFDEDALSLYYGENASDEAGVFGYSGKGDVNEKSGLVIIEDGDLRLGFHFHKASVKRDDAIELPIDDLAALPVRFTFLDHEDELLFSWINEDLFNVDVTP